MLFLYSPALISFNMSESKIGKGKKNTKFRRFIAIVFRNKVEIQDWKRTVENVRDPPIHSAKNLYRERNLGTKSKLPTWGWS